MRNLFLIVAVLVALFTPIAIAVATQSATPAAANSCCYPGSPCCFEGSPCCEPDCCTEAASCCETSASCCK
jgi:hypothetical protein